MSSSTKRAYEAYYRHMRQSGGQRLIGDPVEEAAYQSYRAYQTTASKALFPELQNLMRRYRQAHGYEPFPALKAFIQQHDRRI